MEGELPNRGKSGGKKNSRIRSVIVHSPMASIEFSLPSKGQVQIDEGKSRQKIFIYQEHCDDVAWQRKNPLLPRTEKLA